MAAPTVFVSYKRQHAATTDFLLTIEPALQKAGFHVLRDQTIEPGERWSEDLYRWLMECSGAVVILSDEATRSDWCRREWSVLAARAATTDLKVVPVWVEPTGKTDLLDDLQSISLGQGAVQAVLSALAGIRHAPPTPEDYLAAHRAWLEWQFKEQKVLGREPFSLADVYVDTECGVLEWVEISEKKRDAFDERHGGRNPLVEQALAVLGDERLRDLIVVQGPAGSGKSTFSLKLAHEIAARGLMPVLVRFRDLRPSTFTNVEELLTDAVRVGPAQEQPPQSKEPLLSKRVLDRTVRFGNTDISQVVVIMDGWDEVSLTGNVAYQAQLQTWLPRVREFFIERPGKPVRLLMTGRPSIEVNQSGVLRSRTPILTVRPIRPEQLSAFAAAVSDRLANAEWADPAAKWTLDIDDCEAAFATYAAWFKSRKGSGEVLGSPLLALLAFRTLSHWTGDPSELFRQPSALYHALVDVTTEHSGKGAASGLEGTVHRGGKTLRRLLQRVAAVISSMRGESVSFKELSLRLEEDEALQGWVHDTTARNPLHALVINFYFKGGHADLGCEFLHKSFREYLYAEAIVGALEELSQDHPTSLERLSIEYWKDFPEGTIQHRASRRLGSLLGPQWLSLEVRGHIFWLLHRAIEMDPARWRWIRELLADVYAWWAEGAHLRPQPEKQRGSRRWRVPFVADLVEETLPFDHDAEVEPYRTTSIDAHLGDSLMQITAFVHARLLSNDEVASPRAYESRDGGIRFRPGGGRWAKRLYSRIDAAGWRPMGEGLVGAFLQAVDLSGDDLTSANLTQSDMRNALLREASLVGADLGLARLDNTDLEGATLRFAFLSTTSLSDAKLARADLSHSLSLGGDLARSDLSGANLEGVNFAFANLKNANLQGAKLGGTNFHNANLSGADLRDTDFRAADWPTANLDGAVLPGDATPAGISEATGNVERRLETSKVRKVKGRSSQGNPRTRHKNRR